MGGRRGEADQKSPLLEQLSEASYHPSSDHIVKRTGTVWTAVAHIITAVIGSGVLSLAWSVAQLGWVGGPVVMLLFAAVTKVQSSLLADCYIARRPQGDGIIRNSSYVDAVQLYLGEKKRLFCSFVIHFNLYGCGVVYTLTAATSMRAIQKANCYHKEGHDAPCSAGGDGYYMLVFGIAQVVLSQIPDFHNMGWLSFFAALMSFSYSIIGFGLGIAKVIANGATKGGIGGIAVASTSQKVWRVSQALGDIAFAYPYSLILLQIEDTLRSPPPENETMKKASTLSILITTFFYLGCGCFGYAAFGDRTPGNLLTGFGFYEPYWLIDFANLCIALHLLGGYQVYTQPVFAMVERQIREKFPGSKWVNESYSMKPPLLPACSVNLFRLCFRALYVATTTVMAMSFPYFNQVIGLLGAFAFWPLAIYFPVEMYLVQKKVERWTKKWIAIEAFSAVCLLASVFASFGSAVGVFSGRSETS